MEAPRALSAEPLTEEEEASLRRFVRFPGPVWSDVNSTVLLGYLGQALATLDAARAAITPEAAKTECWACGHPSHGPGRNGSGCSECFCTQTEDIGGRPLAALRVTPVEGEAGLRAAAQDVLKELDIIRDQRSRTGKVLVVHVNTHKALRAALSPEDPSRG